MSRELAFENGFLSGERPAIETGDFPEGLGPPWAGGALDGLPEVGAGRPSVGRLREPSDPQGSLGLSGYIMDSLGLLEAYRAFGGGLGQSRLDESPFGGGRLGCGPLAAGHFVDSRFDGPPPFSAPGANSPLSIDYLPKPPIAETGDLRLLEMLDLMAWGRSQGASDLVMTSEDRPFLRISGRWLAAANRFCRLPDLSSLLNRLTRNEAAAAMVLSGTEMDFGCEVSLGRGRGARFRGNASAVANGWTTGLTLTLRALPDQPPALESLNLEPELQKALFPDNGLVLVTGVMGSGKSTLLAAALRKLCETASRHVATYESPIEFDLCGLEGRLGPVEQSEAGRHVPGFAAAARNSTRRAADAVLIGESRDPETIRSLLEAAEIGVAAYTTVHSRSVASTPNRIISVFERSERPQAASALISALRLIVQQRLYPRLGGGRVAVREFLAFDQEMREDLLKRPWESLDPVLEGLVRERGQNLEAAARIEAEKGNLSPEILSRIQAERGRGR